VLGVHFIVAARTVKSTKRSDTKAWNLVHNGFMLLGILLAWPTLRMP